MKGALLLYKAAMLRKLGRELAEAAIFEGRNKQTAIVTLLHADMCEAAARLSFVNGITGEI